MVMYWRLGCPRLLSRMECVSSVILSEFCKFDRSSWNLYLTIIRGQRPLTVPTYLSTHSSLVFTFSATYRMKLSWELMSKIACSAFASWFWSNSEPKFNHWIFKTDWSRNNLPPSFRYHEGLISSLICYWFCLLRCSCNIAQHSVCEASWSFNIHSTN